MTTPLVIIYERQPRWALLMRRELQPFARQIREVRSAAQARDLLGEHGGSFLLVDVDPARIESQIDLLVGLTTSEPTARAASAGDANYARIMAEAGAVAHFATLFEFLAAANMAQRQLVHGDRQTAALAPSEIARSWRERITWPTT